MNDKLHALLSIGSGYRTYIVAIMLVLNTFAPVLTGEMALGEVDFRGVLEGLGLATLRAGIK